MTRNEIKQKVLSQYGKYASNYGFNTNWCALFVNYIFNNMFKGTPAEYSCTAQKNYWIDKKAYFKNIIGEIGDIVYYDFNMSDNYVEHVGIITHVDTENKMYTVTEGNFGALHWSKTKVQNRVIPFTYLYIDGIAKPKFESDIHIYGKTKECISISPKIKIIQEMLNAITTSENAIECDGIFGDYTENRVKNFQKDNKLEIDGIAGIETLTKLTKIYFNL